MNEVMKRIDRWLCRRCRRYKLQRICKVLGIKPYQWQRDFALKKTDVLSASQGRATGKTTAVMLRMLLSDTHAPAPRWVFNADPDYIAKNAYRIRWYETEYRRLCKRCLNEGIFVAVIQEDTR